MVGLTTSQSRGLHQQKKQLLRYCHDKPKLKHQHDSLHGKKYHRKENHRGDITYIPRNLLPLKQI